jgi:hypothetical protein
MGRQMCSRPPDRAWLLQRLLHSGLQQHGLPLVLCSKPLLILCLHTKTLQLLLPYTFLPIGRCCSVPCAGLHMCVTIGRGIREEW